MCPIWEAQKDLEEVVRSGYDQDVLYRFFEFSINKQKYFLKVHICKMAIKQS